MGAIAFVSLGLTAWSCYHRSDMQSGEVATQRQLSHIELQLRQAESAQAQGEDTALLLKQRLVPLDEAIVASQALVNDPALRRWRERPDDLMPGGTLDQRVAALLEQLRSARQKLVATPEGTPMLAPARQTLSKLEEQLREFERQAIWRQQRLDVANIVLLILATIGGIWMLTRAQRQRHEAMETLKAREAELLAFAGALPDLAFLMDEDGRYLAVYGNNSPLLGRPREELIGRPLSEFFSKDASGVFLNVLRRAIETGQTQSLSYPIRVMGSDRHFDSRCSPVGHSKRVVWMIWDVTARRRAEHRLIHMTRLYDFLSHVNQAIVWAETPDQLLHRVCDIAIRHGGFKKAWVAMSDDLTPRTMQCVAQAGDMLSDAALLGFELRTQRANCSPLQLALLDGLSFHSPNLEPAPADPAWAQAANSAGLTACAVLPLRKHQELVGYLILLDRLINPQDQDEKALLEDVANDLSFALTSLDKEQLREQNEDRIRLHAAALESSRDGMIVFNREGKLVSVNPAFTEITGHAEDDVLGCTAEFLFPDDPQQVIKEIQQHLRLHGTWDGEAWCQRKGGELFSTKLSLSAVRNLKGVPSHFVAVLTDITQLKQTEARLARMAHFDTLTQLPNRSMILDRLAHALNLARRHQSLVGVVFVDLDNFKTVNDSLGHAAGDALLQQVAERLRVRVRQEDTLGRLGGDEFILVLEHLRHPQQAAHVAQAVIDTLAEPFTLAPGQSVYVRASIGISIYPNDSTDAGELIRDADTAMYQAKRLGRNNFRFYTESLTSQASDLLQLETRLRRAVEGSEFLLHYQPMIRLSDNKLMGLEALVRLRVPEPIDDCLPSIGPDEFIPVMEDAGMIMALGEWVLQEACRQGRQWLDAGLSFGRLAVNVSAKEVRRGGVIERVSRVLRATGFPASKLEIEITESGLMEHGDEAVIFLQRLHDMGVTLSIDDFGTGYSSLAYLKRFPVAQLKIDRSFVQDLPGNTSDAQLVNTMVTLAHNLNMRVIAEGVETPGQEAFLRDAGCDLAQGYLFCRPMAGELVEQFLTDYQNAPKQVASAP